MVTIKRQAKLETVYTLKQKYFSKSYNFVNIHIFFALLTFTDYYIIKSNFNSFMKMLHFFLWIIRLRVFNTHITFCFSPTKLYLPTVWADGVGHALCNSIDTPTTLVLVRWNFHGSPVCCRKWQTATATATATAMSNKLILWNYYLFYYFS